MRFSYPTLNFFKELSKRFLLLFTLFGAYQNAEAQTRQFIEKTWDKIFNDTSTTGKPKFIAYPVLAFTPETSWEFGASALYIFNSKNDVKNRLSEVNAFSFYTLENQYGLWLDHAIYTDKNEYFFFGKFRMQQFPLLYHGIGINAPAEPTARIDGFSFTLRERLLKKIRKDLYFGLELDLNHLSSVSISEERFGFASPAGTAGFTNYGIGLGLVYDQRYNVLNPREGLFIEGGFLHYDQSLGSDFAFQNYFLDARYYQPTYKNQLLAYQFLVHSVAPAEGSNVPFNQLALMGGENLMRGYYLGRYRNNNLVASQVEYRFLPFPFSKRIGGTIFGSAGTISSSIADLRLDEIRAAGGLGLRFLLFPGKDIYTRFDVAASNDGLGYYLFIGEAF